MVTTTAETEQELYFQRRAQGDALVTQNAYREPNDFRRAINLHNHVLPDGFFIQFYPNQGGKKENKKNPHHFIPDFRVVYKEAAQDGLKFREVLLKVKQTAHLTDTEYAEKVLPEIKKLLRETHLFSLIEAKGASATQSNPVIAHVMSVPDYVTTTGCNPNQVVVLRYNGLLHDIAKAFSVDKDAWHDHALLSAVMTYFILEENQDIFGSEFAYIQHQTVEVIRFHHVLQLISGENGIDKLDLRELAEFFVAAGIDPKLIGLFTIADCLTVAKENKKNLRYGAFLAANTNGIARLLDEMSKVSEFAFTDQTSEEIKNICAAAMQVALTQIVTACNETQQVAQRACAEAEAQLTQENPGLIAAFLELLDRIIKSIGEFFDRTMAQTITKLLSELPQSTYQPQYSPSST